MFRTSIKRIPALFYCAVIVSGIVFARFGHFPITAIAYILLSVLIVIFILYVSLKRNLLFLVDFALILCLFLSAILMFSIKDATPFVDEFDSLDDSYLGMLLNNPICTGKNDVLKVQLVSRKDRHFLPTVVRIQMEESGKNLRYGDVVLFSGKLRKAAGLRNPGGLDYAAYLKRKDIDYVSYVKPNDLISSGHIRRNPIFEKLVFPLQTYCKRAISHNLSGVHRALLLGLTLGLPEEIPREVKEMFSNAGVVHILAVSGLHVGIISFFLFILLRGLRISFGFSVIISCVFLIFYAFLTGLRAPVVRSTIMFVFIMIGLLSQRRIIIENLIAASAILILLFNPEALFDAGFQLSYAATFSIVLFSQKIYNCFPERLREKKIVRNYVLLPFSVSFAAQLGTAPIVAYYFFRLPLAASIANLVVVPLMSLAIPTGFLSMAGGVIHPVIAKVLTGANWIFLDLIIRASDFFSSIPHLLFWVKKPSVFFFLAYYPGVFLVFFLNGIKRMKFIVFASLIILNLFVFLKVWQAYHPLLSIAFLDVSEGDASFLEFPDGDCCLVDGGRRSAYVDYGEKVLIPFLRSKGIERLNTVIVTHPDADHYGGLITIIRKFNVERLLINGSDKITFLYRKLLTTARNNGVPVYNIHSGEVFWVGGYPMYVLNPPILKGLDLSSNEGSIVFKFGYGEKTFLFTGDFSNRILKLPSDLLPSTVLKFPHHGAEFGNERRFLSNVHPEVTTISVGENNIYGHPAGKNIAILDSLHSRIYRTDRDGAIILRTDGKRMWVKTIVK